MGRRSASRSIKRWEHWASRKCGAALARFYVTLRDEAVARATGKKDVTALPLRADQVEALLGTPGHWREMADQFLRSVMKDLAKSSLRNAQSVLGGTFSVVDIEDPRWLVGAAQRTAQLIRVAVKWRTAIRDRIIESYAKGDQTVAALGRVIEDEFGDVIASNGLTIARTETGMLGSQIREEAFRAEGIEEHEWSAAGDDHTRESHRIDGERRKIGEAFTNGLRRPHDPAGPPEEVINCRCAAVPVA